MAPESRCSSTSLLATYRAFPVDKDRTDLVVNLNCVQPTYISYGLERGGAAPDTRSFSLMARRKDLAGIVNTVDLGHAAGEAALAPGDWEMLLQPGNAYAVTGFSGGRMGLRPSARPDGWNEFTAGDTMRGVRFTLSNSPASLHGMVTGIVREAVMGAPVYLEGYDSGSKARIGQLRTAYTDKTGAYQFDGLSPGTYRIVSTFEYAAPDTATLDTCSPILLTIGRSEPPPGT